VTVNASRRLGTATSTIDEAGGLDVSGVSVVFIGVIIIVIGFVSKIVILWTIGIIAVVVGVILALLGTTKYAVGGRRHWF
jgi:hypothetical protein